MQAPVGPRVSKLLSAYYLGFDHPMKLRVWTWMRKVMGHRPLTVRYCSSGWISLDERDFVQRCVLEQGLYEPEVWDALFASASESEVLWDIGSHIGTFAVRSMLDSRVAIVHAFEADRLTHSRLRHNVRLNASCQTRLLFDGFGLISDRDS